VVALVAKIIEQARLVELGEGTRGIREPPAGEVEEIVGVSTHRTQRQAARPLCVQEFIEPGDLAALLVHDAIGRDAGGCGRTVQEMELHR
jgi:hypothetical protein